MNIIPDISSVQFSSVQFSCLVVPHTLRPRESQHARPPCPSPTPFSVGEWFSQWCHPAISSSVIPFSSCPQSLPASESYPMSQLFAWGSQSTGVSASASVLPMNTQDRSPLGWTGWISLQSNSGFPHFLRYLLHTYKYIYIDEYMDKNTFKTARIWYSILNIFYCLHLWKENKLKLNRLLNIRI